MKHVLRCLVAKYSLSGILHYCLPTLLLGGTFRLGGLTFGRRYKVAAPVPRSIIVFRLDRIGDLVLNSAMLRELRRLYQNARITLVVTTATQSLVEHCPYVDEVLTVAPSSGKLASLFSELRSTVSFCRRHLSSRSWDMAISPRWDADSHFAALMCSYADSPRRIAFSEQCSPLKQRLNWRFDSMYTEVLPPGRSEHEVERNLDVVRHLGGKIGRSDLELWLTRSDEEDASRRWADFGLASSDQVIAFGIGASHGRKRWPSRRFAELIDLLRADLNFAAAIICGPDELPVAREVQSWTSAKLLLLDRPSLRQTAAFLSRCTLFVGNDSGPIHIAAARGIPVVGIWCHPVDGDSRDQHSPDRFGPFTQQRAIVRPLHATEPCNGACTSHEPHCIARVPAADVADAVMSLMENMASIRQIVELLPHGD
jgi:ADP-heptose:LPS heptosyltransferase